MTIADRSQLVMREGIFHVSIPRVLEGFFDSVGFGLVTLRLTSQNSLGLAIGMSNCRAQQAQNCQRE